MSATRTLRRQARARCGIVLVVTLWVLAILAILALTFAATMHVEARAAKNELHRTQALYAARAGLERAILAIGEDQSGYASNQSAWAYLDSEDEDFPFANDERYEVTVTDECGKIDVNEADEALLEKLPQLTPQMIDGLLDWCDADSDPHPDGAEADYYGRLRPARACANRPLLTLPELLLIRGFTKEDVYGTRAAQPAAVETAAAQDESLPLLDLLTLYAGDNDLDAQGQDRLNLNVCEADALAERAQGILTQSDAQAIVDYREDSGAFDNLTDLLRVPGLTREKLQDLADLVTTQSRSSEQTTTPTEEPEPEPQLPAIPGLGGETGLQLPGGDTLPIPGPGDQTPSPAPGSQSTIDVSSLPTADEYRTGIYNVNTAPAEVLATLEGITEQAVEAIVRERETAPFATRGAILALPEVTDAVYARIGEQVTVRSSALKIVSVGSAGDGRVRVRLTAILDLKPSEPRIVHLSEG
jgi:competence ComEA-like helix-hairpin-helix protein